MRRLQHINCSKRRKFEPLLVCALRLVVLIYKAICPSTLEFSFIPFQHPSFPNESPDYFKFSLPFVTMTKLVLWICCVCAIFGFSNALLTHSQALSQLQAEGITVSSSGSCSDRNNRRCTSLDQIRENTISGLIALKRASRCGMVVTGGTETGHGTSTYSHWNGYKADVRLNSCINNYVENTFTYVGLRSDGARKYQAASGNIYAKEGNHWDIVFY